jgi:hypothetical protein
VGLARGADFGRPHTARIHLAYEPKSGAGEMDVVLVMMNDAGARKLQESTFTLGRRRRNGWTGRPGGNCQSHFPDAFRTSRHQRLPRVYAAVTVPVVTDCDPQIASNGFIRHKGGVGYMTCFAGLEVCPQSQSLKSKMGRRAIVKSTPPRGEVPVVILTT